MDIRIHPYTGDELRELEAKRQADRAPRRAPAQPLTVKCDGVLVDLAGEIEKYRVTAIESGARCALADARDHLRELGLSGPKAETLARAVEDLAVVADH